MTALDRLSIKVAPAFQDPNFSNESARAISLVPGQDPKEFDAIRDTCHSRNRAQIPESNGYGAPIWLSFMGHPTLSNVSAKGSCVASVANY
jgi:hypothetical protein